MNNGNLSSPVGTSRRAFIPNRLRQKSPLQGRRGVLSFAKAREYRGFDLVTQGISC